MLDKASKLHTFDDNRATRAVQMEWRKSRKASLPSHIQNVPSGECKIVKLEKKAQKERKMIKSPNIFHAMNFYCNNFSIRVGRRRRERERVCHADDKSH
jgi:hypothetical protein